MENAADFRSGMVMTMVKELFPPKLRAHGKADDFTNGKSRKGKKTKGQFQQGIAPLVS